MNCSIPMAFRITDQIFAQVVSEKKQFKKRKVVLDVWNGKR